MFNVVPELYCLQYNSGSLIKNKPGTTFECQACFMLCSKAQTVVFPENADTLLHPNRHQRTLLKSVILRREAYIEKQKALGGINVPCLRVSF